MNNKDLELTEKTGPVGKKKPSEMTKQELEALANSLVQKEIELLEKEAELTEKIEYVNYKEKAYDKINIDVKTLDKVIIALFIMLAIAIGVGMYKGHFS